MPWRHEADRSDLVGGKMVDVSSMMMATRTMVHTLVLLMSILTLRAAAQRPMKCSLAARKSPCVSYLYFINNGSDIFDISRNFNVPLTDILPEPSPDHYLIKKTCDCSGDYSSTTSEFFTTVTYTPQPEDPNLQVPEMSRFYYGDLVYIPTSSNQRLQLLCGCPHQDWTTVVTYIIRSGDELNLLSGKFHAKSDVIRDLNNIASEDLISIGQNLFIPTNSISSIVGTQALTDLSGSSSKRNVGLVAGIIAIAAVLLVLVIISGSVCWWKRLKNHGVYTRSNADHSGDGSTSGASKGQFGKLPFIGSWFHTNKARACVNNNVKRTITLPKAAMDVFDLEKPIIFTYEEIIEATDNFNESRILGRGSYGAVYSGLLRQQNVAIKQMKTTKSKEFYAELKVLCKVHHTNLVELLGYSAGGADSLFLIYEFAENGALSEHLHDTTSSSKDHPHLSWTARVQIALDTARGLEYIHDHTKAHYVHRDVKTSNILLDEFFRAKVADFGLAKLVEQNSATFITASRVVGTYGYMPPEYMQGGQITSKSDVYAFGVVLFELITGRQAMSKTDTGCRSLISFMLDVLKEEHDPRLKFQDVVDQRLGKYFPLEWSFKMAKLARACIDEDPDKRPDMRTVVFTLSQFLLNSVEWETAFAGSSKIFSGLTQGR